MTTNRNGIDCVDGERKHNQGNLMFIYLFKNMTLFVILVGCRKEVKKKLQIINETSFQRTDA